MNKNRVIKVRLPENSRLKKSGNQYDYEDSFQTTLNFNNKLNSTDIAKAFCAFTLKGPEWIKNLMIIRNSLVSLFGRKKSQYDGDNMPFNEQTFDIGEKMYGFKILGKTENEIIFGKDDKHLNFRSSFLITNNTIDCKIITLSTVVEFNNWLGRLYFIPVKPFHKLIMRTILSRILMT